MSASSMSAATPSRAGGEQRRAPRSGLAWLVASGLLWGTGGLTGRRWPSGRAAWTRIAVIGLLAALYQGCYFTAVALTSVSLATLLTIGSAPVMVLVADQLTGRRRLDRLAVGAHRGQHPRQILAGDQGQRGGRRRCR